MADKNVNIDKKLKMKIVRIEKIYQEYSARINELNKKQSEIIKDSVNKLEQDKIDEIRKVLQ